MSHFFSRITELKLKRSILTINYLTKIGWIRTLLDTHWLLAATSYIQGVIIYNSLNIIW